MLRLHISIRSQIVLSHWRRQNKEKGRIVARHAKNELVILAFGEKELFRNLVERKKTARRSTSEHETIGRARGIRKKDRENARDFATQFLVTF